MKEFFTTRFQTIVDFFSSQRIPSSDLKNLFVWNYWTESYLPSTTVYSGVTLAGIIALIIGLLFWRIRLKKLHRETPVYQFEIDQLLSMIFFVVIMSGSYAFFRAQQIAYASSRLVLLASIVIIAAWLIIIIVHLYRTVPAKRASHLEKERFFRYLPKKRK